MSTNDGGPAFPLADSCCEYGNTNRSAANGMTLRDYFAAKAMQAYVSSYPRGELGGCASVVSDIAADSYDMADAMLEARSKE